MKRIRIFVILFAFMASCNNQEKNSNNTQKQTNMESQDKTAIEKTLTKYFGSLNASDVATAVGSYTPDGVFMPAKFPTAVGTDQLVAAYGNVFKAIQLNVVLTIEEIVIRDDMAFASTRSEGTTRIHATGETIPEENREFFLLRKDNGAWKIARYMFNQPK
ncbi:MAG: YybH family protein [Chitinophagaceae bacterium]